MPRPRADMDTLLAESIRSATYLLRRNAVFLPFAVALGSDGRVQHVQGAPDEEPPEDEGLLALAQQALRELAAEGKVRAVALVSDVRIRRPGAGEQDAIRVQLEHARDRPVTCFSSQPCRPRYTSIAGTRSWKASAAWMPCWAGRPPAAIRRWR